MPKITLENGKVVEISEESYNALSKAVKKELPKKWEDLGEITGYFIANAAEIIHWEHPTDKFNQNLFRTKEQAKAALALAQLSQLMYVYNEGWGPRWEDSTPKWVIYFVDNKITFSYSINSNRFLAFKSAKIRDEFLKNFRDLIEQAKPLL